MAQDENARMVCNALQGKTNFVLTSCSTIFTWILLQNSRQKEYYKTWRALHTILAFSSCAINEVNFYSL